MSAPKTFEMEIPAHELTSLVGGRLHEACSTMSTFEGHGTEVPDAINAAESMLQVKRALSQKADFILLRVRYEDR